MKAGLAVRLADIPTLRRRTLWASVISERRAFRLKTPEWWDRKDHRCLTHLSRTLPIVSIPWEGESGSPLDLLQVSMSCNFLAIHVSVRWSSEGPCLAGWRYRSCPLRRRRCEGLKLLIPLRWPEKLGWLWPWDHDVGSTWQDLTPYDIQAFLSFRVKLVDVDTRSLLFQQKTSQVLQSPFPRFTLQLHSFHPPISTPLAPPNHVCVQCTDDRGNHVCAQMTPQMCVQMTFLPSYRWPCETMQRCTDDLCRWPCERCAQMTHLAFFYTT